MTGADVKRQVIRATDRVADYLWRAPLEGALDAHGALAQAHTALAPCIVLTAEEAELLRRALAPAYIRYDSSLLALLTPDQEASDPDRQLMEMDC